MEDERPSLEARLAALRTRMEEGLPARAAALRAALDAHAAGAPGARDEVRRLAHKLRGIAGSHGHEELGLLSGEVEALAADEASDRTTLMTRGLALVDALARAGARRTVGQGLPSGAPAGPIEPERSPAAPATRPLAGRRVLAIDDDAPTRRLLELTLVAMGGADARVLESPEEALALLEREAFEVVLVDAMMPTRTGLTFAREARERATAPRFALFFFSAATPEELGWTLPEGARWLQKPFRPRQLLDALRAVQG